jgi:hypothetical protein
MLVLVLKATSNATSDEAFNARGEMRASRCNALLFFSDISPINVSRRVFD